jgi:hypothetical protein
MSLLSVVVLVVDVVWLLLKVVYSYITAVYSFFVPPPKKCVRAQVALVSQVLLALDCNSYYNGQF